MSIANQTPARNQVLLAQIGRPLRSFLATEAGGAGILLVATLAALAWANSPLSGAYESLWGTELTISLGDRGLDMDLQHWLNDGLMTLFFFVIGLELRRELSVGELRDRRRLAVPAVAAGGGLIVPALLYLALNPTGEAATGWGVVIGTDTAFLLGALALVGPAHSTQLRLFLLSLTIVDDVLAVTVIGAIYSESLNLEVLAVGLVSLVCIALLSQLRVWQKSPYLVAGLVLWAATLDSGLHPSIAGVAAGMLVGAYMPRREEVEQATGLFLAFRQSPQPDIGYSAKMGIERAVSMNERLQVSLHPVTSYLIVPLFALANAGVDLRNGLLADAVWSPVTWGVVLGLVLGKATGIALATLGAVRLKVGQVLEGVGPGQVLGGASLSGIGFTVSLLIADLAFTTSELREEAQVGVLTAGVLSFLSGGLIFRLAGVIHGETTASLPMVLDRHVEIGRDHIRGLPNGPLTLVEYGDFECPFCGAATGVVRELRERFGDELRYVFRHLPLVDVHPDAELAALAAEASAQQGNFWEMHDLLFQHQDELEYEDLIGYAANLDLDVEQFSNALADPQLAERVREDAASADASGVRGTPTFFIGDRRHIGPWDTETLARELVKQRDPGL